MAKFTLKGAQSAVGGVTGKYSTNVLAALLDDTNLLDITNKKEVIDYTVGLYNRSKL